MMSLSESLEDVSLKPNCSGIYISKDAFQACSRPPIYVTYVLFPPAVPQAPTPRSGSSVDAPVSGFEQHTKQSVSLLFEEQLVYDD